MGIKIGITGSGTMGSGIAQVAATAGCQVKLYDTNQEALDKAKTALEKILNRLIEKGRINSKEKNRIQSNISYVDSLKDLSASNLTIEAIVENLDPEQESFVELDYYVSKCINLLVKPDQIGQAGGISLSKESKVNDYLEYLYIKSEIFIRYH